MSSDAFQDWLSLFNENISKIWSTTERKEFKKAAMIVNVLGNEFNKILGLDQGQIKKETENQLAATDMKPNIPFDCKCFPAIEYSVSSLGMKENNYTRNIRNMSTIRMNNNPPLRDSNGKRQANQEWSTPEICLAEESQEILLLSDDSKLNGNIEDVYSSSDGGKSSTEIERSPTINKHRKFSRVKKLKNITCSYSVLDLKRELPRTHTGISSDNTTPNRCDVIDSTIIEGTPDVSCASKKSNSALHKTPQKSRKTLKSVRNKRVLNNSTLTQMFSNVTTSTKCNLDVNISESKYGHCDGKLKTVEETWEDAPDNVPNNEENYLNSRTSMKTKGKVPEIKYKTTVRGKERMRLEGWDCEECAKFYEGLDMTPNGVKALMNKCSRHRSKFKPDDYTPAGNMQYMNTVKRQ